PGIVGAEGPMPADMAQELAEADNDAERPFADENTLLGKLQRINRRVEMMLGFMDAKELDDDLALEDLGAMPEGGHSRPDRRVHRGRRGDQASGRTLRGHGHEVPSGPRAYPGGAPQVGSVGLGQTKRRTSLPSSPTAPRGAGSTSFRAPSHFIL